MKRDVSITCRYANRNEGRYLFGISISTPKGQTFRSLSLTVDPEAREALATVQEFAARNSLDPELLAKRLRKAAEDRMRRQKDRIYPAVSLMRKWSPVL